MRRRDSPITTAKKRSLDMAGERHTNMRLCTKCFIFGCRMHFYIGVFDFCVLVFQTLPVAVRLAQAQAPQITAPTTSPMRTASLCQSLITQRYSEKKFLFSLHCYLARIQRS